MDTRATTLRSMFSDEELDKKIKIAESIKRLESNDDYKFIFEELLFNSEPARLVSILSVADPDLKEITIETMEMISNLKTWLRSQKSFGEQAIAEMDNKLHEQAELANI